MILTLPNSLSLLSNKKTNPTLNRISFLKNQSFLNPDPKQVLKLDKFTTFDDKFGNFNLSNDNKFNQTALLVIDMQNDFVLDDGLMRVKGGKGILPNVVKTVEVARQRGILVVWVVREHDPLGRDVELFRRHLYTAGKVPPMAKGSRGAELVDGLVIKEEDYKLVKTRFSAFLNTNLHSLLQTEGIRSLVISGIQIPNCIRQTVFDAVSLDYQDVLVIIDATAAAAPEIHAANIADMKNIGVATSSLQEWCEIDA